MLPPVTTYGQGCIFKIQILVKPNRCVCTRLPNKTKGYFMNYFLLIPYKNLLECGASHFLGHLFYTSIPLNLCELIFRIQIYGIFKCLPTSLVTVINVYHLSWEMKQRSLESIKSSLRVKNTRASGDKAIFSGDEPIFLLYLSHYPQPLREETCL